MIAGAQAVPAPGLIDRAAALYRRARPLPLRYWRKRQLRADYLLGATRGRALPEEPADPAIIEAAHGLRAALLQFYEDRYAVRGYRVLMLRPSSITAEIWFGDLARCMRHSGVECRLLAHDTPTAAINAAIEEFAPNVFVATEAPEALAVLDLDFLARHKRAHGCLRLFIPVFHSKAPGRYSSPAEDAWRRDLRARGRTADAYFSIFEREFHELFTRDDSGPPLDYAVIPQACNPFVDFPVDTPKRHDYFMATSLTDERLDVSCRYLRPILRGYRGLWAGPRWGFGLERVAPGEMPRRYAESRIALSPLVGFVHRHGAELTHRVYAAAACGAFQITMATRVTERFFERDELARASTPSEFVQLFEHYVGRPDERNAMALAALRRVYDRHTCFHRVDALVTHWDAWRPRGLF